MKVYRPNIQFLHVNIYGYNLYKKAVSKNVNRLTRGVSYIANVTYLYNYGDSPNSDYYWVDTYDESVITFVPPVPTREGVYF